LIRLATKATAIFGAALTAITGANATEEFNLNVADLNSNSIQIDNQKKIKPMPLMKLNPNNPDKSQFIAQHRSHSSHSSHSSHRSHYSHRSGGI